MRRKTQLLDKTVGASPPCPAAAGGGGGMISEGLCYCCHCLRYVGGECDGSALVLVDELEDRSRSTNPKSSLGSLSARTIIMSSNSNVSSESLLLISPTLHRLCLSRLAPSRLAPSRLATLMAAARSIDPPKELEVGECCGSSCVPCVKTLYQQERSVWEECLSARGDADIIAKSS